MLDFGNNNQMGNVSIGDVAGRDMFKTNISGSGNAIGPGATSNTRNVETGGGDYAEGNIDKRTVHGPTIGTIHSGRDTNVATEMHINRAEGEAWAAKRLLPDLLAELRLLLREAPSALRSNAEVLDRFAVQLVEEATSSQPNQASLIGQAASLKAIAPQFASALPKVAQLAEQLAEQALVQK